MNTYQNIINKYVNKIKKELGKELKLLLVIGSSSSSKVIPNWSDIDVIIVVDNYTFKLIENIKKISSAYEVKIGTTIYTKKEFDKLNLDSKTFYNLYLLENKKIKLQYKSDDIKLPIVSFKNLKNMYESYLYEKIHLLKRQFLYDSLNKKQIKEIYKIVYYIIKAVLINDKELPLNYDEAFKMFSQKYNLEYFDYEKFINNYLNDDEQYREIIEYAKKVLLFVIERY